MQGIVQMQGARRNGEARDAGGQYDLLRGQFEHGLDLEAWEDNQRGQIRVNGFERVNQGLTSVGRYSIAP